MRIPVVRLLKEGWRILFFFTLGGDNMAWPSAPPSLFFLAPMTITDGSTEDDEGCLMNLSRAEIEIFQILSF